MNKLTDMKSIPHLVISKKDRKIEKIISKICRRYEEKLKI
jgi:hypothetical protein